MIEKGMERLSLKDFTSFKKLETIKFYFGHMSVGYNILEGIKTLSEKHSTLNLNIKETAFPGKEEGPAFIHSKVGANGDPFAKIIAFENNISTGTPPDAAALKFCYADIHQDTDTEALFAEYHKAFKRMEKKCPRTCFIHFTVPLTCREEGMRMVAKKLLGKTIRGRKDNLKRNRFNSLLKETYSDRVFDIAGFESTDRKGKRKVYTLKGETYWALVPEYTSDGGHLNALGQEHIAENWLAFLMGPGCPFSEAG